MGLNLLKKYYTKKIRINAAAEALAISLSLCLSIKFPKIFQLGTLTKRHSHVWHTPRRANVPGGWGWGWDWDWGGKYERSARKAFEAFDGLPWKRNKLSMCWSVDYEYVYTWAPVCVCVRVRLLSSTSHFRVQFQEKILRNADEIFIIPKRSSLG